MPIPSSSAVGARDSRPGMALGNLFHFRHDTNSDLVLFVASTLSAALVAVAALPLITRVTSTLASRLYLKLFIFPQKMIVSSSSEEQQQQPTSSNDKRGRGVYQVSELCMYPVKSLRVVTPTLEEATIGERGLVLDRHWMIVTPAPIPLLGSFGPDDATHKFLTQRQCPCLATVQTLFDAVSQTITLTTDLLPGEKVTFSIKDDADDNDSASSSLSSSSSAQQKRTYRASVWSDTVLVEDMGDEPSAFLQKVVDLEKDMPDELKPGVRLVRQSPLDHRAANDFSVVPASVRSLTTGQGPGVSLSDGFPILIASTASLKELNRRLTEKGKQPLSMNRFRPNIVISSDDDLKPFEEDTWKVIRVGGQNSGGGGGAIFHVVKACPRCKQSCTDQLTGQVTKEPLETMVEFRALHESNLENLYFAQNATPDPTAIGKTIRVGDSVEVLQWGEPVFRD